MKHIHHIIPKHMGGTDDLCNLIELDIKDRAEAHKIFWETHRKLEDFVAWKALSGNKEESQIARKKLAVDNYRKFLKTEEGIKWIEKNMRGKDRSKMIEAARIANTGRSKTTEEKIKNANAHIGKKHSKSTISKLKDIAKNRSNEHIQKIANSNRGKKRSEETRRKIREANLKRWSVIKKKTGVHLFSDLTERGDPNAT